MDINNQIVLGGMICIMGLVLMVLGAVPLALLAGIIGGFLLLKGLTRYL